MPPKALCCAFIVAAFVGSFPSVNDAGAASMTAFHGKTGHRAGSHPPLGKSKDINRFARSTGPGVLGRHERSDARSGLKRHASRRLDVGRSVIRTSKGHHATRSTTISGMASWYADGSHTASGAQFKAGGMTAAHRTLPFGTQVLVRSLSTGRSVQVTINDRGPFVGGRVIDLARGAATQLGIVGSGVGSVELTVLR